MINNSKFKEPRDTRNYQRAIGIEVPAIHASDEHENQSPYIPLPELISREQPMQGATDMDQHYSVKSFMLSPKLVHQNFSR
jgi:hypothetical protein